ncbi:hypothetical protein G5S52_07600 [Grimontia sp. S25]|uniref:Uncharacterized protein n=1 Tax=Grimontia sedimenti TaxID=2711294 RepID=A0A6M1R5E4_9GAMM|nr:hypothetical protein [Grimontia sedimenti]NGN97535.1 hypothetical protein [Grimontia sedimenti]
MSDETKNTSMWQRAKEMVKRVVQEAPMAILGVVSFSLLFMLGLVTLGISLMAGIAAIIAAKWQQRQMYNDIANPTDKRNDEEPIAAV